jgi:hypothetical protein
MGCRAEGKKAAGMVCGGQRVFYFRFSIFVLALGFRPPGRKKEKRRTKNEKGKEAAGMVCGGQRVFYFRFSIFVLALGFRPPGEKKKKEERRRKKEKSLLA